MSVIWTYSHYYCHIIPSTKAQQGFYYGFCCFSGASFHTSLLGDFNIHKDNVNSTLTKEVTSCLDGFGLQQYVNSPTHVKGHILYLICCSGVSPVDCKADSLHFSDHMLLSFSVNLLLSKSNSLRTITFRKFQDINLDYLSSSIASLNPDELVSHYNINLHNLLNNFAPLKTRRVSFTVSVPWFTPLIRQLKIEG